LVLSILSVVPIYQVWQVHLFLQKFFVCLMAIVEQVIF
jgi:hypothetical protein